MPEPAVYILLSLRLLLKSNPFDIFIVSETWLNSSILNYGLSVEGYSFVRQGRRGREGGGRMIYILDSFLIAYDPIYRMIISNLVSLR